MSSILFVFTSLIYLILIGISIYLLILLVILAHKGIKALDIYIDGKTNEEP